LALPPNRSRFRIEPSPINGDVLTAAAAPIPCRDCAGRDDPAPKPHHTRPAPRLPVGRAHNCRSIMSNAPLPPIPHCNRIMTGQGYVLPAGPARSRWLTSRLLRGRVLMLPPLYAHHVGSRCIVHLGARCAVRPESERIRARVTPTYSHRNRTALQTNVSR
jgi:hypothetical protein